MTDPKPATVAVSVEDLRQIADTLDAFGSDEALALIRSHIPKPKPRLVAVTQEQYEHGYDSTEWVAQPDLLTLLDEAINDIPSLTRSGRDVIKARIRTALGVDQ